MSCPGWRPDCIAKDAADGMGRVWGFGNAVADGVGTVASATTDTLGAANRLTAPIGGLAMALPLLFLGFLLWLLFKLVGFGKDAAPAVVAAYTGVQLDTKDPKTTGRAAGEKLRVKTEQRRGPKPGIHDGHGAQVVDRENGPDGRPKRVVVCASGPGEAATTIGSRMGGRTWNPAGSKPCDLQHGNTHYSFTTVTKKKGKR